MKQAIIGLGSNQGNRASYLARARDLMESQVGEIIVRSSVIETASWGFDSYPFLNQIVIIQTILKPLELLDQLQHIERQLGRAQKSEQIDGKSIYHDRVIDIDILDYDGLHYQDERLTLPHPEIHRRDFIQKSLQELGINL